MRSPLVLATSLAFVAGTACGDNSAAPPSDAAVILLPDAGPPDAVTPDAVDPPDAAPPDAFVCTLPSLTCGVDCIDVTSDEQHCGDCTTMCTQAGSVCASSHCACPGSFLPDARPTPILDQLFAAPTGAGLPAGTMIGLGPFIGANALDSIAVVWDPTATTGTQINHDYTLTGALAAPSFGATYNINILTTPPQPAASFFATTGTLNFSQISATCVTGTLTGATFAAVTSITDPTVDPAGCTFTVASLTFKVGSACP